MNRFLLKITLGLVLASRLALLSAAGAEDANPLYANDFEKLEIGKAPDDFLVLDGNFTVQQDGTNKFLELPGAPLDSYGVLFGPTVRSNVAVTARIFGTSKGRRYPTFAVGLLGQAGYRLQVSPAKGMLELYHGDEVLTNAPYEWKSGTWTRLRLQIVNSGAAWKLEGKAWAEGAAEPDQPMISFEEKQEPAPGKSAVFGSPFATTPIRFDDLVVRPVPAN